MASRYRGFRLVDMAVHKEIFTRFVLGALTESRSSPPQQCLEPRAVLTEENATSHALPLATKFLDPRAHLGLRLVKHWLQLHPAHSCPHNLRCQTLPVDTRFHLNFCGRAGWLIRCQELLDKARQRWASPAQASTGRSTETLSAHASWRQQHKHAGCHPPCSGGASRHSS